MSPPGVSKIAEDISKDLFDSYEETLDLNSEQVSTPESDCIISEHVGDKVDLEPVAFDDVELQPAVDANDLTGSLQESEEHCHTPELFVCDVPQKDMSLEIKTPKENECHHEEDMDVDVVSDVPSEVNGNKSDLTTDIATTSKPENSPNGSDEGMDGVTSEEDDCELQRVASIPPLLSPVHSNPALTTDEAAIANPDPMPYNGPPPIEICFSFDTTGSMSSCLDQVKNQLQHIVQRLFMDIPSLKISLLAHGDYCDETLYYLIKRIDFTNDIGALCGFLGEVEGTGGGDWEECYELVMRKVADELSWTPGSQRALVMIGDAIPHATDYVPPGATEPANIDWRNEADNLYSNMGVMIYAIQCGTSTEAEGFWRELALQTAGRHLKLDQFGTIVDIMMAICYREFAPASLVAYEKEVRAREGPGFRKELKNVFQTLGDLNDASDDDDDSSPQAIKPRQAAKKISPKKVTFAVAGARKMKTTPSVSSPKKIKKLSQAHAAAKNTKNEIIKKRVPNKKQKIIWKHHGCGQLREKISEGRFVMNQLNWTPWHLAFLSKPPRLQTSNWLSRPQGQEGCRNKTLFKTDNFRPAVYEISVQPANKPRNKKYAVYITSTRGISRGSCWDTYLLKNNQLREGVSLALKENCRVFVRRAIVAKYYRDSQHKQVLSSAAGLKRFLEHRYDYAWNNSSERPARTMTVKNFTLPCPQHK